VTSRSAESTAALKHGLHRSTWTVSDLWIAAMGIGGALRRGDVVDITTGDRHANREEHDVLASALNDYFTDHDEDHPVALWDALATT
jgi:hypothetical protein